MATTFNGWTAINSYPSTYFTAPGGKRVYCANSAVATVFEYVAARWHREVEPIAQSHPDNRTAPRERRSTTRSGAYDLIGIHCWRSPGTKVGTGDKSNHRSGTGMDINGHLHPYEATMSGSWYSGFTSAQKSTLRSILNSVRDASGNRILRWGYDFARGKRDAMHLEIAPGVSARQVREAAARLGSVNYEPTGHTTKQVQQVVGATVDGDYGPKTTAAVKDHQQYLAELGYPVGTPDGKWGPTTNKMQERYMSELSELKAEVAALRKEQGDFRSYVGYWFNKQWDVLGTIKNRAGWTLSRVKTAQEAIAALPTETASVDLNTDELAGKVAERIEARDLNTTLKAARADIAGRITKEDA